MLFKITPKQGSSFTLDEYKLYEQLMMAVVDKDREQELKGGDKILGVLANYLCATGFIAKHDLTSSLFVAFKLGYYFAKFLDKQEVIIEEEEKREE